MLAGESHYFPWWFPETNGTLLSFFFHLAIIEPWINLIGYDTATAQSWGDSAFYPLCSPSFISQVPTPSVNKPQLERPWLVPALPSLLHSLSPFLWLWQQD